MRPASVTVSVEPAGGGDDEALGTPFRERPSGGPRVTVVWRWYRVERLVTLCAAPLWLSGWLYGLYESRWNLGLVAPFALLSAVWLYVTVGLVANKTTLTLDDRRLRVRIGPLPWLGAVELPSAHVRQVACVARTVRSLGEGRTTHSVLARLASGQWVPVLTALPQADVALFLAQRITARLGLPSERPAEGEPTSHPSR